MRISAAISRGPDTPWTVEDVSLADPGPDEVLVRLVATGICHTDLVMKRRFPPGTAVVLGHEGAGVVERVGRDVDGIAVGDHVVLSFQSCAHCAACVAGRPAYCERFFPLNMSGKRVDGTSPLSQDGEHIAGAFFGQSSFATYAMATPRNVVVVGGDVDLAAAAPFGCSLQTGAGAVVNVLRPDTPGKLVVFGAGAVGLAAIMAARALGLATIVAVDLNPTRREAAAMLGAHSVLDGADPGVVELTRTATGGGATHALDTTGVPAAAATALAALRPLGELVLVGLGPSQLELDAPGLLAGGKTVRGCMEGDADPQTFVPRLVEWRRAGAFPVDRIIRTYPFRDIQAAVDDAAGGHVIKPVLVFDPGA